MLMVLLVARSWDTFRFGTKLLRSSMLVMPWASIVSAVTADTVSGTSWRFSVGRRAVTTKSWIPPEADAVLSADPLVEVWACAGGANKAADMTVRMTSTAAAHGCVFLNMRPPEL